MEKRANAKGTRSRDSSAIVCAGGRQFPDLGGEGPGRDASATQAAPRGSTSSDATTRPRRSRKAVEALAALSEKPARMFELIGTTRRDCHDAIRLLGFDDRGLPAS